MKVSNKLFQAVKDEKPDAVATLLSHGENVNARGIYGETPIYWAIKQNDIKTVKVLVKHGAKLNRQDKDGNAPIHVAAGRGRIEILKLLLANGARKDLKSCNGMPPLDLAIYVRNIQTEIIALLRNQRSKVALPLKKRNVRNREGKVS